MKINIEKISPNNGHYFFGYYDLCPWDRNESYLLALKTSFLDQAPENKSAEIGLIELKTKKFIQVDKTYAWNWQQGSRAQWFLKDSKQYFVYNTKINNQQKAIISDLNRKKEVLPMPLYRVFNNGQQAIAVNFSRLNVLRKGYGYSGNFWGIKPLENLEKDGLFLIDFETQKIELLVSLKQLKEHQPLEIMSENYHWLDVPDISFDDKYIAFLHRFLTKDKRMYSRLFVFDIKEKKLKLLLDSGYASHFCWKNNSEIVIWARLPSVVSGFSKTKIFSFVYPIYKKLKIKKGMVRKNIIKDSFLKINIESGKIEKFADKFFDEDGHCSFSRDEKWFLTDTYPDKNHFRKLFLFHLPSANKIELGSFYSLPKEVSNDWDLSSMRCDLHPRFNKSANKICFDSVHEGKRGIYIAEIEK